MTVPILYASIEGQTKKIASFLEICVRKSGAKPVMIDANQKGAGFPQDGVQKLILAASVHRRRHPLEFEKLLRSKRVELEKLETLFVSVSLCAAFAEGMEEAESYLTDVSTRTGFKPSETAVVAGALQYGKVHDYEAQVIRLVALELRRLDEIEKDREFTDWSALEETAFQFLADC